MSTTRTAEAWALEMQQPPQMMTSMPGQVRPAVSDGGIRVFSLRDLTEGLPGDPPGVPLTKSPEVVLTAVRAALDLAGNQGGDPPELKFHEDSGLLIVHGNNEQVGAVMQTLDQMRDDIRRRRDAAKLSMQPRADVDQLRAELRKAEVVRSQATRDMDRCRRALEQAKQRMEAGQASHAEVSEQEAKADEAEARAQMADIDMGRLKKMIDDAQNAGRVGSPDVRAQALQAQIDQTSNVIANTQQVYSDAIKKGDEAGAAGAKQQVDRLEAQREALRAELRKLTSGEDGSGGGTPQGKSVAVYDVGDMGAKAREQLISSIRALETAINNPEKLKIQSIQGESKLVIEADGAMHAVVRGMCKEVMGARGEPGKADGKPKPRGK